MYLLSLREGSECVLRQGCVLALSTKREERVFRLDCMRVPLAAITCLYVCKRQLGEMKMDVRTSFTDRQLQRLKSVSRDGLHRGTIEQIITIPLQQC